MVRPETRPIGIPEEVKPWAHVVIAHHLDGQPGIRRAVRQRDTAELETLQKEIPTYLALIAAILADLEHPQTDEPSVWDWALPIVKAELERRRRPKPTPTANSPIARLKSMNLVAVAEQFTRLVPVGNKLKGLCPLHQERTPSFYVIPDRQKWRCYGACAKGGDIVDLLDALAEQGKRL